MTDDLFERNTMSFGEHLEELRTALVKACLWLALGTSIGLYYSEQLVQWMSAPFRQQLRQYRIDKATDAFRTSLNAEPPKFFLDFMLKQQVVPRAGFVMDTPDLNRSLSLAEAAESSREAWMQLLAGGAVPNLKRQVWLEPIPDSLSSFGIFEGFYIYLQASLIVGITLGLPGIFWHLWNFVAAGLYAHERRKVYKFLPLGVMLFLAGASLAYFVMIELLVRVMLQYNIGMGVEVQPRLTDCFSLAMWLPLIFGLCFQLPLAMMILTTLGLVSAQSFIAHQRVAVLIITFVSMLLTPADPYTFVGLLIPLALLYYVGIALCRIV